MSAGGYCRFCGTENVKGDLKYFDPRTGQPRHHWLCPVSPCHNGEHVASKLRLYFGIGWCTRCGERLL